MNVYKFMKVIDEINFSIFMRIYNFMKFMRFMNVSILQFKGTGTLLQLRALKSFRRKNVLDSGRGCGWWRMCFSSGDAEGKEEASERNIMNLMNTYCFIVLMNIMTHGRRRTTRMVADSVMFAGICWA